MGKFFKKQKVPAPPVIKFQSINKTALKTRRNIIVHELKVLNNVIKTQNNVKRYITIPVKDDSCKRLKCTF